MRLTSHPSRGLAGAVAVPGDKSISHRALILGALAAGETRIEGLLEGEDVLATARIVGQLGAAVERTGPGAWRVAGRGIGGLVEPDDLLDFGNSGTAARLLLGVLAGHPLTAFATGDASLRRRPMGRVIEPLSAMGAQFVARAGGRLPLGIVGAAEPMPQVYRMPVASAQVKSAVLLAGLAAPGETTALEPEATRDHTERMLRAFGAEVRVEDTAEGRAVTVTGQPELSPAPVVVPADPSSAAFPLVAGLICSGAELTLPAVGVNPYRAGLIETLLEMGADLSLENRRDPAGEPLADLRVRASALRGVEVPPERAPSMIDEYPVLAVAAAFAEGTSVFRGVGELRVKESDRLAAVARGLAACGVAVEETEDSLTVHGRGPDSVQGGAEIAADLDHRIAMSFLVLGLAARRPVAIDDARTIDTSFPGFAELMRELGADLRAGAAA
jgi:3-phosphoshikimate 1-carboxyvinyltransferase